MKVYRKNIRNFLSVPSRVCTAVVMPAKAGIQTFLSFSKKNLDSRFRGNDKQERKKVMVFGVFDRLHAGHVSFLEQAARLGDELFVAVARDSIVQELKKKMPMHPQEERMRAVRTLSCVDQVVLGDVVLGSYDIMQTHKPDMICLGYDQHGLAKDLRSRMAKGELEPINLMIMKPHEASWLHTSLLAK